MSGQVEADYLDEQASDLIATERQRINWGDPLSQPLLTWGQERVKTLLRTWQERRAAKKYKILEDRLVPFAERLARFPKHEQRIVERALRNMAKLSSLNDDQYVGLGESVLTAWEAGRLKELIDDVAQAECCCDAICRWFPIGSSMVFMEDDRFGPTSGGRF